MVRCGPDGCVVALPGADPVVVPGVAAEVVDLNGAGDAHAGAFIAQLALGVEPLAAAAWANAAAAIADQPTRSGHRPDLRRGGCAHLKRSLRTRSTRNGP